MRFKAGDRVKLDPATRDSYLYTDHMYDGPLTVTEVNPNSRYAYTVACFDGESRYVRDDSHVLAG